MLTTKIFQNNKFIFNLEKNCEKVKIIVIHFGQTVAMRNIGMCHKLTVHYSK